MCLYNKHNNRWLLGNIEFLFSCSIRYPTRSLRSLVRYRVNTRREIPYLLTPMYYCLYIHNGVRVYNVVCTLDLYNVQKEILDALNQQFLMFYGKLLPYKEIPTFLVWRVLLNHQTLPNNGNRLVIIFS